MAAYHIEAHWYLGVYVYEQTGRFSQLQHPIKPCGFNSMCFNMVTTVVNRTRLAYLSWIEGSSHRQLNLQLNVACFSPASPLCGYHIEAH